ncbi:hypothetical protein BGX26_009877 [Mortierella sp. AD094]|nr:hypothetical protein BGX26_009877 [Mortierella sp. AD094]
MVDRLGAQMILSSIRDIRVAQAFELLIAHDSSLVGTYASGDESEQAYRASGLVSEILLTNAISISRELELEKSIYKLHKHTSRHDDNLQEHQILELLNASSLWLNLRIWDGHYVFFKPINRVLRDLDDLAQIATCMIAIDDYGNKLETASTNSNEATPDSYSDSDQRNKTDKLRSAGRTILAYRIRAMAATHGALSKITDTLASARDKNNSTPPNVPSNPREHTATSPQVKGDIASAVRGALEERSTIERSMQTDMVYFSMIDSARLAEEWVLMELNAILAMLCTVGTCKGAAFVLITYHEIQQNFDSRVMSMIQAAQRLEEFDSNRYYQTGDSAIDEQERLAKPPLSICQLGSKFVRDMVATMQKWRLDSSIHRMHRMSELKSAWKTGEPLPARASDSESRDTLESATHNAETPPSHDPNMPPLRTKSTTQFAAAHNAHPVMTGPLGTYETNAPSLGGYVQPLFTDYLYTAHPQAGFTYPTQLWQSEVGNARTYGSMEHLLSGTYPAAAASDIGGMFDASLLDTYLDSLFQQ